MNLFKLLNAFVLSCTILLLSISDCFASGLEDGLSGDGTVDAPYLIQDIDDFSVFASDSDYWLADVYVQLTVV